ncbi:DUF2283 domain-containing protein [Candidatus Woesearchaeota archaeon]|nr:DUF2283 domain-containing protein [Candidatus Woesearchaeota archaeon]
MMRIEYDKDVDAAYIYLTDARVKSVKTVELNENIILDYDREGKIIGVEVLQASVVLSKKVLAEAGKE